MVPCTALYTLILFSQWSSNYHRVLRLVSQWQLHGALWFGLLQVRPLGKMVLQPNMSSYAMNIRMYSMTNQTCHHIGNWTMPLFWLLIHFHCLNIGSINSARQSRLRSSSRLNSCLTVGRYLPLCHLMAHQYCLYKKRWVDYACVLTIVVSIARWGPMYSLHHVLLTCLTNWASLQCSA